MTINLDNKTFKKVMSYNERLKNNTKLVGIKMLPEMVEKLEKTSAEDMVSKSQYVRNALEYYWEKHKY